MFSGQSPPCSYELCGSSGTVLCPVPFIHDRATKTTCKVHVPIQLAKSKSLTLVCDFFVYKCRSLVLPTVCAVSHICVPSSLAVLISELFPLLFIW